MLFKILFVLALILLPLAVLRVAGADPIGGGHGACDGGTVSIGGSADLVTYNAGNNIIDGVCVKAGNTAQHDYYTADVNTGCYAISGIGTSVVIVTRLGEGRECQGLSHIDVTTAPTPTSTPTPTPSATPTPTPSPNPTTTPTPTPTASTSTSETPLSLPNTGAGAVRDEGGTNWLSIALGLSLLAAGLGTVVYYARKGQ